MSNNTNRTKTQLSDVLFLFTTRYEDPLTLAYEIECATLSAVTFTLNFEGSENFRVMKDGSNVAVPDMKLTAKVRPFGRVEMGKVAIVDVDRRASLRLGCSWAMEEPDQSEIDRYMKTHNAEMNRLISDAKKLKFPPQREDLNNQLVVDICNSYGKSFIDKDFPPNESSLYPVTKVTNPDGTTTNSAAIDISPKMIKQYKQIEWKRPQDFMKGDIHVFDDGIVPNDIRQGNLGDCWFLSALAAIAEFPILIDALFPPESKLYQKQGVYNIKLCKNGTWTNVRIDDYFPCFPGAGPIFSRSNGNELWVLLAEKAYAKVHGSYDALRAGWSYEALLDLTGAPCRNFRLDDPLFKIKIDNGELWSEIMRFDLENYIMTVATPGEDEATESGRRQKNNVGLVAGHAYTLISARTTSKGDRIVKLRNPWGSMEWTGDWSDSSPLWTAEMQNEIEPLVNADDGTFWMSFEDMMKYFVSLTVCMSRFPGLNKKPWKESRRKFFFDFDRITSDQLDHLPDENTIVDEFRILCPMYQLTLSEKSTVVVTIHQEDIRCQDAKPYIDIGVSILKTDPIYGTFQLITGTGNSADRQNATEDIELDAGKYLIVPTTSGCKLRQYMESFGLYGPNSDPNNINNNNNNNSKSASAGTSITSGATASTTTRIPLTKPGVNTASGKLEFTDDVYRVYTEIFTRNDQDSDGFLNKDEIDQYMLRTEGSSIEPIAYQWLLHNFENRESQGLSLAGFLRAQLYIFNKTAGDEEKLWNEFKLLGYDDQLQLRSCRSAVISVHSIADFQLETLPYDENAYLDALELVIMNKGDITNYEENKIKIYKYHSGFSGISIMVENKHHLPLIIWIDCTESENLLSHRGNLEHKDIILPNKRCIMHHLCPKDNNIKSYSLAYSASYMWDEQ